VLWYRGDVAGAKEHFVAALKINPQLRAPRMYLDALTHQNK